MGFRSEEEVYISIINYSLARRTPSKDYVRDVSRGKSLLSFAKGYGEFRLYYEDAPLLIGGGFTFDISGSNPFFCHNYSRQQLSIQRTAVSILSYFGKPISI